MRHHQVVMSSGFAKRACQEQISSRVAPSHSLTGLRQGPSGAGQSHGGDLNCNPVRWIRPPDDDSCVISRKIKRLSKRK